MASAQRGSRAGPAEVWRRAGRRVLGWWRAGSRGQHALVIGALIVLALALGVALFKSPSNAFAVSARSSVVTVEPSCGRHLVWDLPRGSLGVVAPMQAAQPAAGTTGAPPGAVTARLNAGVRARIERSGDQPLRVRFERSPSFAACADRQAIVQFEARWRADGKEHERRFALKPDDSDTFVVYRSVDERAQPVAAPMVAVQDAAAATAAAEEAPAPASAATFVLPLEGRLIVGDAIQQGAGWGEADPPPLLETAEVRVRSRAGWTHQSIEVLQEKIDAGSVVDSAACFQQGPFWTDRQAMWSRAGARAFAVVDDAERPRYCAEALPAPASGFVRGLRDGGLEVQLHVSAYQLAITPHQGETRLLGVTVWQHLTHSHLAQALLAAAGLLIGAGNLVTAYRALNPAPEPAPRRRTQPRLLRRARPATVHAPKETPP